MSVFSDVEACVSPVLTLEEMTESPQVKVRHMIQSLYDEALGDFPVIANPIKLSKTPAKINSISPKLGENTDELLPMKK